MHGKCGYLQHQNIQHSNICLCKPNFEVVKSPTTNCYFHVTLVLQQAAPTCATAVNGTSPFACPSGFALRSNASVILNPDTAACCVSVIDLLLFFSISMNIVHRTCTIWLKLTSCANKLYVCKGLVALLSVYLYARYLTCIWQSMKCDAVFYSAGFDSNLCEYW